MVTSAYGHLLDPFGWALAGRSPGAPRVTAPTRAAPSVDYTTAITFDGRAGTRLGQPTNASDWRLDNTRPKVLDWPGLSASLDPVLHQVEQHDGVGNYDADQHQQADATDTVADVNNVPSAVPPRPTDWPRLHLGAADR